MTSFDFLLAASNNSFSGFHVEKGGIMFGLFQAIADAVSSLFGILFNLIKLLFSVIHIIIAALVLLVVIWIILSVASCVTEHVPHETSIMHSLEH